jgi:hypothetical protein
MAAFFALRLDGFADGLDGAARVQGQLLVTALKKHGLDDPRRLLVAVNNTAEKFLKAVYGEEEIEHVVLGKFKELLDQAISGAYLKDREMYGGINPRVSDLLAVLDARKEAERHDSEKARGSTRRAAGPAPLPGLRSKKARKRSGPTTIAGQESADYKRWVGRFVEILRVAQTPAIELAESSAEPDRFLASMVGSARAGTIKIRVRTWEKYTRWLQHRHRRAWPIEVTDIVEYVWFFMAESPSTSFPRVFGATLAWMELRSGIAEENRFGNVDLIKRVLEKATASIEEGAPERARAPRLPAIVVGALEEAVSDEDIPGTLRVIAWTRLLKTYGVLRADDLQRMRPEDLSLHESGLMGRLRRTKTTGAGKRVRDLVVHVPRSAWIRNASWLKVGFDLWRKLAPWPRDYLIPRAASGLHDFVVKFASTADMAVVNYLVLRVLKVPNAAVPEGGATEWTSMAPLLSPDLARAWSGHSERSTIPSALAALGVPKAERDPLGRWHPEGSDDYVRSYRALVRRLVGKYAEAATSKNAFNDLDEDDAIADIGKSLKLKGLEGEQIEEELAELVSMSKAAFRNQEVKVLVDLATKDLESAILPINLGTELEEGPIAEGEGKYIIALTSRGKFARLHSVGGCWRAKGQSFVDFEILAELPEPSFYNAKCRLCYPGGSGAAVDSALASDEGDEVSGSSSSTSTSSKAS